MKAKELLDIVEATFETQVKEWISRLGSLRQEMADKTMTTSERESSAKDYEIAKNSYWNWKAKFSREEATTAEEQILAGMAKWGFNSI